MRQAYAQCRAILPLLIASQSALASATPVRSSVQSFSHTRLTIVEESDTADLTDSQLGTLNTLGPVVATATIDSAQGFYTATTDGSAQLFNPNRGSFQCTQSYFGSRANGDIDAQSFSHTLNGIFQYDFTIESEGTLNLSGILLNNGPSSLNYFATVQVYSESQQGSGSFEAFFQEAIRDFELDSESFDFLIPLDTQSGSYRIQIRLAHSGLGQLNANLSTGSLSAFWDIQSDKECPADLNNDGNLDFVDVSVFLNAFVDQDPIADLNPDGIFDFLDITAFISDFMAGCSVDD